MLKAAINKLQDTSNRLLVYLWSVHERINYLTIILTLLSSALLYGCFSLYGSSFLGLGHYVISPLQTLLEYIMGPLEALEFLGIDTLAEGIVYGGLSLVGGYYFATTSTVQAHAASVGHWLGSTLRFNGHAKDSRPEGAPEDKADATVKSRFIGMFRGVAQKVGDTGKMIVASAIPATRFVKLAKVIPFGSWYEHVWSAEGDMLDFHYCICFRDEAFLKELIEVLPPDSLVRLLERKGLNNDTGLYEACEGKIRYTNKFRMLLEAVPPEHRMRLLTQPAGINDEPLIYNLQLGKKENGPWQVIKDLLTKDELKQLAYTVGPRGDNLLMHKTLQVGPRDMIRILEPLSIEEKKAYLTKPCPHGFIPIVELFARRSFPYIKEIFTLFTVDDWKSLFAQTPEKWTMTLGEKIVVNLYANDCPVKRTKVNPRGVDYFAENFDIQLPERYRDLRERDLYKLMNEIDENGVMSHCTSKHHFMEQHGQYPEQILGVEEYLDNKAYTIAYRKLQMKHHPDKNQGEDAQAMSAKINAAKDFVTDRKARKQYLSQYPKVDPFKELEKLFKPRNK